MSKLLYFGTFVCGALVGSAVTYFAIKDKYENRVKEEVDSVKKAFNKEDEGLGLVKAYEGHINDIYGAVCSEKKEVYEAYEAAMVNLGYINKENQINNTEKPYIIGPDNFAEFEDYDTVSLIYYADGVLTDEMGERISQEMIENNLVFDFADHFGEYGEDSVYIRNDARRIDYEILKDMRNYSEA